MEIQYGLNDSQVLQRNAKNVCDVTVSGNSSVDGDLQIRVTKNGRYIPGFSFKTITPVYNGKFKFRLKGIPSGGPYDIFLRLVSSGAKMFRQIEIKDILVGDVWILAGQSNMEGIGYLKDAAEPHPMVRAFYMDDRWASAKDPIHNLGQTVDPVHTDLNDGVPVEREKHVGVGPGISFGKKMYQSTSVPQGLICCAHGGSSMSQWDPALKKLKGKSLYGATLRRFHKNGSHVAGVVWYQGESDAIDGEVRAYTSRMKKLVNSIRKDFANNKLPFVMVQIASVYRNKLMLDVILDPNLQKYWNSIQDQQRLLPKVIDRMTLICAVDLLLDDSIHISGVDQQRLGKRLADAAFVLLKDRKSGKLPPELRTIKTKENNLTKTLDIEIAFSNVTGSLVASGIPTGFSLVHPDNELCDAIYRVELKGNKAILKTNLVAGQKYNLNLHYGYGLSPYCNITDCDDRSLPVFGPLRI